MPIDPIVQIMIAAGEMQEEKVTTTRLHRIMTIEILQKLINYRKLWGARFREMSGLPARTTVGWCATKRPHRVKRRVMIVSIRAPLLSKQWMSLRVIWRKEGKKEGKKERRKEKGKKEGRKEGRNEGKEDRKKERKEGRREGRKKSAISKADELLNGSSQEVVVTRLQLD